MKRNLIRSAALLLLATASAQGAGVYGLGATFPQPLYDKMFSVYQKASGVEVTYDGGGSGKGQKEILARSVDFGASDVPMEAENLKSAPGKILHIPTAVGAIVASYTLPNLTKPLQLDGPALADIYLGKITKWNDPALAKLNPGVTLPSLPIKVLYRDEASGTTKVFTNYLSKVSPDWKAKVGESGTPKWPVGAGGKGNEGVSYLLKTTPGAIGYLELTYAKQNKLRFAALKNRAGKFVVADNGPAEDAADDISIPADLKVSLTDSANPTAYPIASFTYLMVYQEQKYDSRTQAQARQLKDLLGWILTTGQQYNESLDYGKLPASAVKKAQDILNSMTYGGQKL